MNDLPPSNQEDLFSGVSGGFDADGLAGYPQQDFDVAHDGGDILNDANAFAAASLHSSAITEPVRHIDPAPLAFLDPSIYQNRLARRDPRHFAHLAVPQPQVQRWQGSSAFGTLGGIHGAHQYYGAAQAEQQIRTWDGNTSVNTGPASLNQPVAFQNTNQAGRAGPEYDRTQVSRPDALLRRQQLQGSWPRIEPTSLQHPGAGDTGSVASRPPLCPLSGMEAVLRQGQMLQDALGTAGETSNHMYGLANDECLGADLESAYSESELPSAQLAQPTVPPLKSVVCPFCKRQLQDRPGLRHHLNIHDPEKASRYKCGYGACKYASRYPKDVKRHNLIHEKPRYHKFVCSEPGCDAKFHRKDFLLRHCRSAHPTATEADGLESSRRKVSGRQYLTIPKQRGHRAMSMSSRTTSLRDGGVSSTGNWRRSQRTHQTPVRSSRASLRSSSAVASSNPTHGDSSFVFDGPSLLPTPQTADSCFNEYLDPRLLSPAAPSDSYYFSATGSPCPP